MKLIGTFLLFAAGLLAAVPTGPAIGQKAPDFELKDQNGVAHKLSASLGPNGAILVFYRSADW